MYVRLVHRSAGLALMSRLPGLSAVQRLSFTGSTAEFELPSWPNVAALGKFTPVVNHNPGRLPVGNQGMTVHLVNAFHTLPVGF